MKNGLVTDFVYAYNLTKDKYMYLLNSDLKEYDVTYLDWLVNDFYYIYGPIMLEETVKKNYVGEELFKEVAAHINEIDKEISHRHCQRFVLRRSSRFWGDIIIF